ncbi:hypothetical protein [Sinobaca sp. H24]|uniref:hypothetical protein n=1 Tax=Sinobaca sp. H24 TaxID=2923376 RepID=UPI00207AEEAD|nr:hypothetical protein [Sinobaca sp. H24]
MTSDINIHKKWINGIWILLLVLLMSLYLLSATMTYANILTNGFIHKDAVHLNVTEEELALIEEGLEEMEPSMLIQYDAETAPLKQVYRNSTEMALPPFKEADSHNECLVIRGEQGPSDVPCEATALFDARTAISSCAKPGLFSR